ncbi:hypothetical protein [Raoultibacter phocaeensis]|uniref:hypothetical protein n=1 Tax=Raoultibacter phocaeensis TaxID=2479841 RepID=UPI001118FB4E|nr:hypothetical protein [Raoultibacter phocaeensis]
MNHTEFMALESAEAAKLLNERIAAGKTPEEAEAEFELTQADKLFLNIFWVKGKYLARVWGGYTSVKPTGNEKDDTLPGKG